jgi:hypothetical protein
MDREQGVAAVEMRAHLRDARAFTACGVDRAPRFVMADEMHDVAAPNGNDRVLGRDQAVEISGRVASFARLGGGGHGGS